jgi:hypothetical protein
MGRTGKTVKEKNKTKLLFIHTKQWVRVRVMVFNATFNNISVISCRSDLLVDETRVIGENHWPATSVECSIKKMTQHWLPRTSTQRTNIKWVFGRSMVIMFPLPIKSGPYYTTDTIIELKVHWGYRNYRRYIKKMKNIISL